MMKKMKIIDLEKDSDGTFKPASQVRRKSKSKTVHKMYTGSVQAVYNPIDNVSQDPVGKMLNFFVGQLEREAKKLIHDIFR